MSEEQPALESNEERSARHSRMVRSAVTFVILLTLVMFAFSATWLWVRDGRVDLAWLAGGFLIIVLGLALGMAFDLRKRW